ncbi:hypothetical protein CI738_06865 [Escherichia coli]|nr:hypothetical protein CI738_06865 [Escherichia coli]
MKRDELMELIFLGTSAGVPTRTRNVTAILLNLQHPTGNDSNLLIVFYVQIMPDDFVMQLHRF